MAKTKVKLKKKFDWDYFLDKSEKKVVHCETKQEAEEFCRMMHEHGLTWLNIRSNPYVLDDGTIKSHYHDRPLCYSNMGTYDYIGFYNIQGSLILRFSAYDFT